MTGYIISYQQQNRGHNGSVNVDIVTSTIITRLTIGATYSFSIVATSNTLPSTKTTVTDITIGIIYTLHPRGGLVYPLNRRVGVM